jgi:26S proteasome non-ATPase regulatory subunit 10
VKLLSSSDEAKTVINSKDDEGWAPLHSAASIGNAELVEVLLTRGADVNAKNNGGRTALHYAASKGRLEIAQLLLTHGAKINITDKVL